MAFLIVNREYVKAIPANFPHPKRTIQSQKLYKLYEISLK